MAWTAWLQNGTGLSSMQLSIAFQSGKCGRLPQHFLLGLYAVAVLLSAMFKACGFVLVGDLKKVILIQTDL